MKKLYALGARTGLHRNDVDRMTKLGVLGLLAFGLASLAACFRAQKAPEPAAGPQTLQDLVNSVNASTAPAKDQDHCGPYPGYPCGTRYYTVSRSDFSGLA